MAEEFTDAKWLQSKFNKAIGPLYREWAKTAAEMAGATDVSVELFDMGRILGVAFVKGGDRRRSYRVPITTTSIQELHEWMLSQ